MDQPRRQVIEMTVESRSVIGKQTRALRRSGQVPVTVYGPGSEPLNLQVEARHLRRVLVQAGSTKLITVNLDGRSFLALAREIQRNPIRGDFIHIDLYAVDVNKTLHTAVPLVFDGEPTIIRNQRALLTHTFNDLEVECLPNDLPAAIHIDISRLVDIGDSIYVRDIVTPPGVRLMQNPDDLVIKISPLATQAVEPVAAAVVAEGAEVEAVKQKEKKEE